MYSRTEWKYIYVVTGILLNEADGLWKCKGGVVACEIQYRSKNNHILSKFVWPKTEIHVFVVLYRPSERCSWLILAWTAPVPGHEDDMWRAVSSVEWSCWGCPVVLWRNRETAQQARKLAVARHTINIHRPMCRFIQLGRLADRAPIDSAQWP